MRVTGNDEARCALAPGLVRSSGDRIRTCDLWVMSPASYRAAPPRVGRTQVTRPHGSHPTTPVTASSHRYQGHARLPVTVGTATYSPLGARDDAARMRSKPQPVEIRHAGIWYSGGLIGWRHGCDGRVAARVRCRVDGLRHSTWKDLADLRLPAPKHPPRAERFPAVVRR